LYWQCFVLVAYVLYGIIMIHAIRMNIIIIILRVIIVITIIKVSAMLVLMSDGSRVSMISIF